MKGACFLTNEAGGELFGKSFLFRPYLADKLLRFDQW